MKSKMFFDMAGNLFRQENTGCGKVVLVMPAIQAINTTFYYKNSKGKFDPITPPMPPYFGYTGDWDKAQKIREAEAK